MLHKLIVLILLCCLLSSCTQNIKHSGISQFHPNLIILKMNLDKENADDKEDINTQNLLTQLVLQDEHNVIHENISPPSLNDNYAYPPQNQNPTPPQKPDSKPEQPIHEHVFVPVYKTIYIEEVGHYEQALVSEGYDLPIYRQEERSLCNNCGLDITDFEWQHIEESLLNDGDCTSFRTTYIDILEGYTHVDAIYEDQYVIDTPSSQQIIIDYYQCQCGQIQ